MYVVVRDDLPIGLQMAQAAHATFMFSQEHPGEVTPWYRDSQYLIIVSVPDEDSLVRVASRAMEHEVATSLWREPDLDGRLTAITLAPGENSRKICSNLPLAGRAYAHN
jgi:peptidyl-tRNA hydrolase